MDVVVALVELEVAVRAQRADQVHVGREVRRGVVQAVVAQAGGVLEGRQIVDLLEHGELQSALEHGPVREATAEPRGARVAIRIRDEADRVVRRRDAAAERALQDRRRVLAEALVVEIEVERDQATRRQHQPAAHGAHLLIAALRESDPLVRGVDQEAELAVALARLVAAAQRELRSADVAEPGRRAFEGCEELVQAGCTERNFWDTMSPFYRQMPDLLGFGVERTADTVGLALAAGATAGVAVHAVGTAVRHARSRSAEAGPVQRPLRDTSAEPPPTSPLSARATALLDTPSSAAISRRERPVRRSRPIRSLWSL